MVSARLAEPAWIVPMPAAPITVRLFPGILGFALFISFFVLVEPAPVDAVLLVLFAFGILAGIVRVGSLPFLPVVLLTGLALANIVSIPGADDPSRAVFYSAVTFYMMTSWALFAGALEFYGAPLLRTIFLGYSVAAVISVIPALASYFNVIGFQSFLLLSGRPKGLFKDPNVYGPYLVLIGLMALTGCLPFGKRPAQLAIAAIAFMGVVFSYSRACWINYAVALVLFVLFDQVLPSRTGQGRSTSLPQLAVFGVLAILALGAMSQIPSVKVMLAARLGQGGMQDYDQIRFQTQQMAVRAAIDHPLGIGPGQSEGVFTYATHSSYMRVLGENGLFGLFCFAGFLVSALVKAISQIGTATTLQSRATYIAVAACIAGHLINSGVVDTIHWRHFWLLLALPWAPNPVVASARVGRSF